MTNNKYVLSWVNEMAEMTNPAKIVWIDGSEEQADALRAEACSTGEMIKLNEKLLPGSLPASYRGETTWLASRDAPSSAPERKRTQETSTTGWIPRNAIQSSPSSTRVL